MKKKIFTDYLSTEFAVSETAREVMLTIKEKVTEELYHKMVDSLRGFESELQVAIASNIAVVISFFVFIRIPLFETHKCPPTSYQKIFQKSISKFYKVACGFSLCFVHIAQNRPGASVII